MEDTAKCYKFIYCNNYTKNFKFLFCNDSEDEYITDPRSEPKIDIKDLYAQLLDKLKLENHEYNFHTYNYLQDIYEKISCKYIPCNDINYHNLINIKKKFPKTLGIIYTYVNLSDVDFKSVKVRLYDKTEIPFNEYIIRYNHSRQGGGLPIKTEQGFVSENTISYYFTKASSINLPAIILEYENDELIVADGNNRIAYYLLSQNIQLIPAIIIIQNPKDILKSTLKPEQHKYNLRSITKSLTTTTTTKSIIKKR
jgi:hypothetical protein